ncbi:hypothetical protein HMSP1_84 [Sinorhizobium phage HMSP1-Susan]|nr:hypothetical protein HMSP1_84 [Sinorhizobium phage HMSP1-Susan]
MTLHTIGMISANVISMRKILERKGQYYVFRSISHDGETVIVKFAECAAPYRVEF